jgi:hypothetical protein
VQEYRERQAEALERGQFGTGTTFISFVERSGSKAGGNLATASRVLELLELPKKSRAPDGARLWYAQYLVVTSCWIG